MALSVNHLPMASALISEPSNTSHDTAILSCGKIGIAMLDHAQNLYKIIQQVKNRDVMRIRERYGPQKGHAGDPMWFKIKLAVTRRETVWWELMDKFDGDQGHFFKFFTKQVSSRKRKAVKDDDETTVAYHKLVQAISHHDHDLQDEQENIIYHDDCGWFSES